MKKHYFAAFKAKVVQEMLKEEKTLAQLAAEYGVSTKQLGRWKTRVLENLPRLFEAEAEKVQQAHEQHVGELYAEISRLTTELGWLKKNLVSTLSYAERRALVEREHPDLSLKRQATLLSLSRASLYYQPVPPSAEEIAIKHRLTQNHGPFAVRLAHQPQTSTAFHARDGSGWGLSGT